MAAKSKTTRTMKKTAKQKMQTSKLIVYSSLALSWAFIVFICYEMHRLCDLSPVAVIGTALVGMIAATNAAYMWRAKQEDYSRLELEKMKQLSEMKKKYGDDFILEELHEVNMN